MNSIFDLKTSVNELESSNNGVTRDLYEQQAPTRDVTGSNFPNGAIQFRFQTGGTKWWCPSRSYIRMRIRLGKTSSVALKLSDDVAPIMNHCSALFQSAEFRINDKTVSRIADYMPQIDTLHNRLNKSKSWIDSVGNSTNFWQSSFDVRKVQVSSDGKDSNSVPLTQGRLSLGYDPLTTVAVAVDTAIMTFATGTIPSCLTTYQAGDIIRLKYSATNIVEYRVSEPLSATTLQLEEFKSIATTAPAAALDFERVRVNNDARALTEYEVTWQPPLSIFQVQHAIPAARCELVLNPQTSSVYKRAIVESSLANKDPAVDYDISIQNMYLYINTVEGSRVDNLTYYLDLEQISCQAETLVGANSFGQKNFDVSPSTKSLVLAFQDTRAGTNTLFSPTKFRSYDTLPTKDQTLDLNRMFISYAGVSKPQIDADMVYDDTKRVDQTTERYIQSLLNSGSYHDNGGSETIEEFHNRGSYYLFNWNKDGNDRSTRVSVHTGFNSGTVLTNARLLLFSIYSQVAKIVINNGSVSQVDIEDI